MTGMLVEEKLVVLGCLLILLVIAFHLSKIEISERVGVLIAHSIAIAGLGLGIVVHLAVGLSHLVGYHAAPILVGGGCLGIGLGIFEGGLIVLADGPILVTFLEIFL